MSSVPYNGCMRSVYAGIDVGTHYVKVVLAAAPENPDAPLRIIATGMAPSKGLRHGYVVDVKEAARGVREAALRAAHAAGVKLTKARVAMGGVGLEEVRSTGDVTLTASGGIVTERDIERVLTESEKRAGTKLTNRTILHTIPLEFRIDGMKVEGRPQGLQGTKLTVDALLITILTQHYDDMVEAVEAAGIEVEAVSAAPLAASTVTLTRAQEIAGVILANIGAETFSLIVYDNGLPTSIKVFPMGGADITNAIALAFRIPLQEAEQLKRGAVTGSDVQPAKMRAAVAAVLKKMFASVNAHLKSIGRSGLLPAGIVLSGGASATPGTVESARVTLKIPAQVGFPLNLPRLTSLDASWTVAYGLAKISYLEERGSGSHSLEDVFRRIQEVVRNTFRSLLP